MKPLKYETLVPIAQLLVIALALWFVFKTLKSIGFFGGASGVAGAAARNAAATGELTGEALVELIYGQEDTAARLGELTGSNTLAGVGAGRIFR